MSAAKSKNVMSDVRSTNIIPIAIYCFVLAGYFLFLGINSVLINKVNSPSFDFFMWLPIAASILFSVGLVAVGIGIINMQVLYWKILFFCLAICISSITSLILAYIFFLVLGTNLLASFIQGNQITFVMWFAFFAVYLSQIIVLFYLCSGDVAASFGDSGPLISPL